MALYCQLDSGSGGAAFTVTSLSCDTFFDIIVDDAVITRDYQLGGGAGGGAFTVMSFSCENSYA